MLIRLAETSDEDELGRLIDRSVRTLQADDYSAQQIAGALGTVFGVDSRLITDGTYFVVEDEGGRIVGCGGWSRRGTLFGSDRTSVRQDSLLDPAVDAAKIRAFFVDPDFARQGIGSALLRTCEESATTAGFRRCELGATITGERLYQARGYAVLEHIDVELANGELLPVIRMTKQL